MDIRKVTEFNGRDIFFDYIKNKYYCWDNGRKIYRVTKEGIINYLSK